MKPMSLAYSRKQRRHRSRPYLRMIPWVLLHTRLPQHSTQQQSAPRDGMALHPLDRAAQLCSTAMVGAAAQQRTPQLTPGAAAHAPATHHHAASGHLLLRYAGTVLPQPCSIQGAHQWRPPAEWFFGWVL